MRIQKAEKTLFFSSFCGLSHNFSGCFVCFLINVAPLSLSLLPARPPLPPNAWPLTLTGTQPWLRAHTCGPMAAGFPLVPAAGAKLPDVQSGISPKACHPNLRGLGDPWECCHAPSSSGTKGQWSLGGVLCLPAPTHALTQPIPILCTRTQASTCPRYALLFSGQSQGRRSLGSQRTSLTKHKCKDQWLTLSRW